MKNSISIIGVLTSFLLSTFLGVAIETATGAPAELVTGVIFLSSFAITVPVGSLSANGFTPYLLEDIRNLAKQATPQYKLESRGFLNLLQSQDKPQVLRLNDAAGHKKSVQVRYKQRWTKDFTDTAKSCDNVNVGSRLEAAVSLSSTRQMAFHVADETIAQYQSDASQKKSFGTSSIMAELMEDVIGGCDAILEGVNEDLLTLAVAAIGKNRANGLSTAKALNIPQDGTLNPLASGLTEMLHDYKINNGKGRPQIVGNGLFAKYMLQQASKSADSAGFDTRILSNGVAFYHDLDTISALGANEVIMYEPNAVQIVEYMEYTGFKAGVKPGASEFGVITLPMMIGEDIIPVEFDFQLKYNDCTQTFTDAYYGTELTLNKGYNIILSKQCGLWTIPTNAYRATDALEGNRGSYRYSLTNS
jgi:hypothetical protein